MGFPIALGLSRDYLIRSGEVISSCLQHVYSESVHKQCQLSVHCHTQITCAHTTPDQPQSVGRQGYSRYDAAVQLRMPNHRAPAYLPMK